MNIDTSNAHCGSEIPCLGAPSGREAEIGMSSSFFLVLRRPPLPLLAFGRRPLSRRSEETSLRPRASSAMENGTSQAAAAATTSRLRLPPADRGVAPDDRVQRTNRKRVVGQSFGGVASVAWTTKIRERKLAPRARAQQSPYSRFRFYFCSCRIEEEERRTLLLPPPRRLLVACICLLATAATRSSASPFRSLASIERLG